MKNKLNLSIRKKILLSALLSLLLAVGLVSALIVREELHEGRDNLKNNLRALTNIVADRSLVALVFYDSKAAQLTINALRFQPSVDHACLYDSQNNLFVRFLSEMSDTDCKPRLLIGQIQEEDYITEYTSITDHGDRFGTLIIRARESDLKKALYDYVFYLLMVSFIALLLAYALITNALRRLSLPLSDLIDTVGRITEYTDTTHRAKIYNDDEIGELAKKFNHMLDTIEKDHKALEDSELRFRTLANNIPIGIFQLDTNGRLVYANPMWYKILELENQAENALNTHYKNITSGSIENYKLFETTLIDKQKEVSIEYSYKAPASNTDKQLKKHITPLTLHQSVHGYIGTLSDITELNKVQKELQHLAFYDPLTELPNRRFMQEMLSMTIAKAYRNDEKIAVLMLDIDNFKKVNDTLGHNAGDELLQIQAARIREAVRDEDTVARMGGDEFTIVLHAANSMTEVTAATNRLLQAISEPVILQNRSVIVNGSIGVALFPDDGTDVQNLARHADMALYEAKKAGRNRVHFYSESLDSIMLKNALLETKLRHALENDLLELYLQPQMDSKTELIVWSEALLRWNDAEEGFISPARFIPLAEETGLIDSIGEWVLNRTCKILSENQSELAAIGIAGISINLSGRQFYLKNLLSDISDTFDKYGIDPTLVEFELTESVIMSDVDHALTIMRGLRNLGCKLSLDDFGTGYSSLSYLKLFPINTLKIDRSFVMDIFHNHHDKAITSTIIAMAHTLGLSVTAEGVETQEQKEFLQENNCEYLQGYLIAMPTPVEDLIEEGRLKLLEKSA